VVQNDNRKGVLNILKKIGKKVGSENRLKNGVKKSTERRRGKM